MKNNKGFTLVELLVAISIMGILALLALPIINQVNENSDNSKYVKYSETMISGAKLYVDSYAIDLFGYDEEGCAEVPFEELEKKGLIKDIQVKDVTCTNEEGKQTTYVKIQKIDGKYNYQESIKCVDSKGTVVFEKKIDDPICGTHSNTKPKIEAIPNKAPSTYITTGKTPIKIKVSDNDDGLANNNYIHYGWSTTKDINSIPKAEWHRLDFGNKEKAESTEKSISIFPANQNNKKYYLYIKPTYVQDMAGNIVTKPIELGPYKFDNVPPTCPVITSTSPATNAWVTQKIKITGITFAPDTKKYQIEYRYKPLDGTYGEWKLTGKKDLTSTPEFTPDESGEYEIKLRVYDEAGNEQKNCSSVGVFKKNTFAPKVTISAYKRNATTGANVGSAITTISAEGNKKTLEIKDWLNASTGGINFDIKVSRGGENAIKSIEWKYNEKGTKKYVSSPTYTTTEQRKLKNDKDQVYLTSGGYRQGVYIVEDIAGNKTTIEIKVKIDRQYPTLTMKAFERNESTGANSGQAIATITANDSGNSKVLEPSRWFNKSTGGVNLEITSSDNGVSGISSGTFYYNTTNTTKFYDNPKLSEGGTRSIKDGSDSSYFTGNGFRQGTYKVTDEAGNTSTIKIKLKIDRQSPTLTLTSYVRDKDTEKNGTKVTAVTADNSDSEKTMQPDRWFNKSTGGVNIDVTAKDTISGVSSGTFKYNKSGTTKFYDNPNLANSSNRSISDGKDSTSFESSGYRQGTYTITDKAGNTSKVKVKFKIDRASPTKPSDLSNSSGEKCTTKNITVKAKSSDKISGIKKWQYKFGSGSWKDENDGASFSIKLTSNRDKTMYIRAVDNAGNTSTKVSTKVIKKSNCNTWPVNSCKIRGSKLRNTGYSWTCTHGHTHSTGYIHFCSKSDGTLCADTESAEKFGYTKCSSKNKYNWVCPSSPYGTAQGWAIAEGH